MPQTFEGIVMSTPDRLGGMFQSSGRSGVIDRGTLTVSRDRVLFIGKRGGMFDIRDPWRVSLVLPQFPWGTFVLINAWFALMFMFNWSKSPALAVFFTVPVAVAINAGMVIPHHNERWVAVKYWDGAGADRQVCFLTEPPLIWWPSRQAAEQLYRGIRSALWEQPPEDEVHVSTFPLPPRARDEKLSVTVVCDDCGRVCVFPVKDVGKVQRCPHCSRYIDVEEHEDN
jgi:hypothetical protein